MRKKVTFLLLFAVAHPQASAVTVARYAAVKSYVRESWLGKKAEELGRLVKQKKITKQQAMKWLFVAAGGLLTVARARHLINKWSTKGAPLEYLDKEAFFEDQSPYSTQFSLFHGEEETLPKKESQQDHLSSVLEIGSRDYYEKKLLQEALKRVKLPQILNERDDDLLKLSKGNDVNAVAALANPIEDIVEAIDSAVWKKAFQNAQSPEMKKAIWDGFSWIG